MAAKKQTKLKTRTTTKKQGFKFRWWMGAVIVLVILIAGVAILRFSQAFTNKGTIARESTVFLGGVGVEPHSY